MRKKKKNNSLWYIGGALVVAAGVAAEYLYDFFSYHVASKVGFAPNKYYFDWTGSQDGGQACFFHIVKPYWDMKKTGSNWDPIMSANAMKVYDANTDKELTKSLPIKRVQLGDDKKYHGPVADVPEKIVDEALNEVDTTGAHPGYLRFK